MKNNEFQDKLKIWTECLLSKQPDKEQLRADLVSFFDDLDNMPREQARDVLTTGVRFYTTILGFIPLIKEYDLTDIVYNRFYDLYERYSIGDVINPFRDTFVSDRTHIQTTIPIERAHGLDSNPVDFDGIVFVHPDFNKEEESILLKAIYNNKEELKLYIPKTLLVNKDIPSPENIEGKIKDFYDKIGYDADGEGDLDNIENFDLLYKAKELSHQRNNKLQLVIRSLQANLCRSLLKYYGIMYLPQKWEFDEVPTQHKYTLGSYNLPFRTMDYDLKPSFPRVDTIHELITKSIYQQNRDNVK